MRHIIVILAALKLLISCNGSGTTKTSSDTASITHHSLSMSLENSPNEKDSLELAKLLQNIYKWHYKNQRKIIDFDVVTKDSFQTGLNYESFKKAFEAIKRTDYFSTTFLNNYKKIGNYINDKLVNANPKYYNEINFPCQEADPWTNFQDDAPDFWDKLKILDFKLSSDQASLKWQTQFEDWTSDKYAVSFL